MAQQFTAAQLPLNIAAALNAGHSTTYSGMVHYDGPEWSSDAVPIEQKVFAASPTSLSEAFAFLAAAKVFLNLHFGYADAVVADHIFAHKVADGANVITSTPYDYATFAATARGLTITLLNDLFTQYEGHRTNNGGVWHTVVDVFNYVGVPLTITGGVTDQEIVERLNLLKAVINDHVVLTSGTQHSSADTGDVSTAANGIYFLPSGGIDYSTCILLITDLRTKLIAHMGSATYHAIADTVNLVTAPAPTVTAGFATLVNEIITKYDLHIASTTYHNVADATNPSGLSAVSAIGQVLAATQTLFTKITAHVRMASADRAFRLVA